MKIKVKAKLRRCPFCGGKAEYRVEIHDYYHVFDCFIKCTNCFASTNKLCTNSDRAKYQAVNAWNNRTSKQNHETE